MSLRERFERKFMPEPISGCWIWTGSLNKRHNGYGQIRIGDGKPLLAHRASYELHIGTIPDGMCVLHKCDVPCCVNPNHLFLGTHADNMRDCHSKGRAFMQVHPELHANKNKTVCKYGHPFTPENTKTLKSGVRRCKACIPRINATKNARKKLKTQWYSAIAAT